MLKIMTGPASSGLSEQICMNMIEASRKDPGASFIAIVPEQATLRMQRMVVEKHPGHSVMNLDIVSFERLAHKVFEELGCRKSEILNDTGKVLILRRVLEESHEDLVLYKKKVHMSGFAGEMKSSVTELRQYGVDDNDLFLMQEAAQQAGNRILSAKLQDIRLIYRRFNESISDRYTTQEEVLSVLARLVSASEMIRGSYIYLDGFTGFTPVQYRLIGELLKTCAQLQVTVTIPSDRILEQPEEYDQFCLSNQTLKKLRETAKNAEVPSELVTSDRRLQVPDAFVCQAADIREEIRFIAERILENVRSGRCRFRDFAVICSDMERYHKILRETFRQAQIPCFIDYKKELSDNALARFVICAVQLVSERFSFDSVFSFLKSGMTDLSEDEINQLENYCLEFGIRGAATWKKEFTKNRILYKDPEQEANNRYFWDLEEINRIRQKVTLLTGEYYREAAKADRTAGEFSQALSRLLVRCHAEEKMERKSQAFYEQGEMSLGKEYEQICGLITDLLDQITDLMGQEQIRAAEYEDLLAGALEEIKVSIIPPSLDAVAVGDLTRTRLNEIKILFLAGANDGRLPAPAAHAGLLTLKEREFLKQEHFELAPTVMEHLFTQHFYLYLMFTKPSREIFLTCAREEDGEELLPSYLLRDMDEILPGLKPQPVQPDPSILWNRKAAEVLARAVGERKEDPDEQMRMLLRYFYRKDPRILRQILSGACFQNRALPLDPQTVLDLYGDVLQGSVSRYETFYQCPFRHFLSYGLRLEERPESGVEAADIGTLYHESLERYSRKLQEHQTSFRDITDELSDRLVSEAVEEAAGNLRTDVLEESSRNAWLKKRIGDVTRKTADVLRTHVKLGSYDPEYFEWEFETAPADHLAFKGKIDRVDLFDGGDIYVKVIDYKSGSKKYSIRDIYTGQQLQLTAYLSEAMKKVQDQHPGKTVRPGGVYYYLIQDHYIREEEESETRFRMSGLTNCEPEAISALDHELTLNRKSSVADIRYGKTGLDSRSSVANDQEFEHLMSFVQEKITHAGQQIREGETSIRPMEAGAAGSSCTWCEYRNICKYDDGRWGSDGRKLPEDTDTKMMEKEIYGR
ncbi:MAG: exodeoxyribonuclease V subunit gamma [Parasporobacterium sp.]|nr:exodeoxyribonuclease V subunit gamma [Parasporobacterium sp.]